MAQALLAAPPEEPDDRAYVLQRYIDATEEERATIEQEVEHQIHAVLATVSEKEHAGIRQEARIAVTRAFLGRA